MIKQRVKKFAEKITPIFAAAVLGCFTNPNQFATAHSVCGLNKKQASYRTNNYLISICLGEASYQGVVTYLDGTGYKRFPIQKEGRKYVGIEGNNNYIIDEKTFVLGTDGEEPIRERVVEVNQEAAFDKCTTPFPTSSTANDLLMYAESNGLIITCYPENMQVRGNYCSTEGCGYSFTFKPQNNALDDAEVQIFLPTGVATSRAAERFVTGDNGLLENNGWTIVKKATPPQDLRYPWVKKIITFANDYEMMGHILLGESMGQAIQVTVFFPAEMSSDYWSSAKPILDNLEFNFY
ncbi:hypothetical protein [Pleurocapsa sp. PCC 7319]|uniref:hypothetical protein n=1 Tax=Pleurocapsa sp. PCC 7319 TaxID=118161 RepID=UPI00034788A4|nr:hypothetical protein [Pleurocapsa sp. PCC 7319]